MSLEMKSVYSSWVARIGYDAEAGELHVQLKGGKTLIYEGVPMDAADSVLSAPSIGEALHREIRGSYSSRDG